MVFKFDGNASKKNMIFQLNGILWMNCHKEHKL